MKRSFRVSGLPVLFFLIISGCDLGNEPERDSMLDATADGRTFSFGVNQSFVLELDLCADAGYLWYHTISDTSVVWLYKTHYRSKNGDGNGVGGMTVETFYFVATRAGACTIRLEERQGWLPENPPAHVVQFTVTVALNTNN